MNRQKSRCVASTACAVMMTTSRIPSDTRQACHHTAPSVEINVTTPAGMRRQLVSTVQWRNAAMWSKLSSRQRCHLLHCIVWNLSVSTMILDAALCQLSVVFVATVLSVVSAADSKWHFFKTVTFASVGLKSLCFSSSWYTYTGISFYFTGIKMSLRNIM